MMLCDWIGLDLERYRAEFERREGYIGLKSWLGLRGLVPDNRGATWALKIIFVL